MEEKAGIPGNPFPLHTVSNYADVDAHGSTKVPMHCHPEVELFLLRQGRAVITLDGLSCRMESDQCICVLGGTKHQITADTPGELFFYDAVHIDFKSLLEESSIHCQPSYRKVFNRAVPLQFVVDSTKTKGDTLYMALSELLSLLKSKPLGFEFGCMAYLNLIFFNLLILSGAYGVEETPENARLRDVYAYIEANYADKISLDLLAGLCSMSKYHFIRLFHSTTSQTPVEYINSLRIKKACDMLRDDDQKVLSIALATGFNDLSNFNRLFKRSVGMTPAEYRRQARLKQSEDVAMYFQEYTNSVPFYSFLL